jgi:hypothetical protein
VQQCQGIYRTLVRLHQRREILGVVDPANPNDAVVLVLVRSGAHAATDDQQKNNPRVLHLTSGLKINTGKLRK